MAFSDRLSSLMKEKKVSKNKLALDLGLNKSSVYYWEQRGNAPDGEALNKLADYFNVSTDYLLGKTDIKKAAIGEDDGLSELDLKLIGDFQKLTLDGQKQVLAFLDYLKHQS